MTLLKERSTWSTTQRANGGVWLQKEVWHGYRLYKRTDGIKRAAVVAQSYQGKCQGPIFELGRGVRQTVAVAELERNCEALPEHALCWYILAGKPESNRAVTLQMKNCA